MGWRGSDGTGASVVVCFPLQRGPPASPAVWRGRSSRRPHSAPQMSIKILFFVSAFRVEKTGARQLRVSLPGVGDYEESLVSSPEAESKRLRWLSLSADRGAAT